MDCRCRRGGHEDGSEDYCGGEIIVSGTKRCRAGDRVVIVGYKRCGWR